MKKPISKICIILFILASLLPMNWSMDIEQANARPRPPLNFDTHYPYTELRYHDAPYRLSWELDVDFPENEIRAKWIFRVEQMTPLGNNSWMLTDEYIQDIECTKHGQVKIQNGEAVFQQDKPGYITCETPNFKQISNKMINILRLGIRNYRGRVCTQSIDPWMNATIEPTQNQEKPQPIGYLESKQKINGEYTIFESTVQNREGWKLYTTMTDWKYPEESQLLPENDVHHFWTGTNVHRFLDTLHIKNQSQHATQWTQYWSAVNDLPNDAVQTAAVTNDWFFWIEGAPAQPTPTQDYTMSNGAHTFYIGHNPDTGEYFNGTMYNIGVDPGCIGE